MTFVSADIWSPPCEYGDLDVLWPNYQETSNYYKCFAVHQYATISCPSSMLFSYVFQECISEELWFPSPPLSQLPLSKPQPTTPYVTPTPNRPTSKVELPTPKTPKHPLTTTRKPVTKDAEDTTIKVTPGKPKPKPKTTVNPEQPEEITTRKQPNRPAPGTPKPKGDVPQPPGPPPGEDKPKPGNEGERVTPPTKVKPPPQP